MGSNPTPRYFYAKKLKQDSIQCALDYKLRTFTLCYREQRPFLLTQFLQFHIGRILRSNLRAIRVGWVDSFSSPSHLSICEKEKMKESTYTSRRLWREYVTRFFEDRLEKQIKREYLIIQCISRLLSLFS